MAHGNEPNWKGRLAALMRRAFRWSDENIPPGLRSLAGLPLIVGGIFGFLPVLGFWMVPVGVVLIALDIPPLKRRLRTYLDRTAEPKG
jgi:hypothetical protein